jgi:boron transporter
VAGLLGLPFPNGLIPQAPFHTESLCVTKVEADTEENGEGKGHYTWKRTHVVEQRVSNLAQGLLTLGTMSGPLLVVLHLIPQAVLAGLFFIMGYQALEANGITAKLVFLLRDKALTPGSHPQKQVRRRGAVWGFVAMELLGFGATFAITQTVAAVGFPVIILALIPVRAILLPRLFSPQELSILDAPTASPFTMESVGGNYHGGRDGDDVVEAGGESDDLAAAVVSEPVGSTELRTSAQGQKSEGELAELGEGRGIRRGSAGLLGEPIELGRLGMSRRGQSSRRGEQD